MLRYFEFTFAAIVRLYLEYLYAITLLLKYIQLSIKFRQTNNNSDQFRLFRYATTNLWVKQDARTHAMQYSVYCSQCF